MDKEKIYAALLKQNGSDNQISVAIEEMAELTKELTKSLRKKGNRMRVIEELSDVEICLDQIKIMFSVKTSEMVLFKQFKLDRLEQYYIGEANNGNL